MQPTITTESAEILALEALGWLAGQDQALDRFLAVTGIDPASLRAAAENPGLGLAVLEFLLSNEELLLAFCEAAGTTSRAVHAALW